MATLTVTDAYAYARAAGFTGTALDVIVAIAQAESGLVTDARNGPGNNVPPSIDRGVLQINDYWHPEVSDACADDPACAFKAAFAISASGTTFTQWTTYTNGAYLAYLPLGGNMTILPNFPYINQLDGTDNANMNCVPASVTACIKYWWPTTTATADILKDAEYGAGYKGGTAINRFHDDNSDLMVYTYHCDAEQWSSNDPAALVAKIHAWIKAGYPVIATIPSQWGTVFSLAQRQAGSISTHVVAFYSEEGGLTAMNPWGAIKHTGSDTYWRDRLCFTSVWRVYSLGGSVPVALLDINAVSAYFTAQADGTWKAKYNGMILQGGMLWAYRSLGYPANALPFLGIPLRNEVRLDAREIWYQMFERGILVYDEAHAYDTQPGFTGPYYLAHLDWTQSNPISLDYAAKVTDLTNKLNAALKDLANAADKTELEAALAQVQRLTADLASMTAARDALTTQLSDAQTALASTRDQLEQIQTDSAKALALVTAIKALL